MRHPTSHSSLSLFILIAIALHWLLLQIPLPKNYYLISKTLKEKDTEIFIEPYEGELKAVVRTTKLEPSEQDQTADDKPARFGAEFKNRVKKETRSARTGKFREGATIHMKKKSAAKFGEDGMFEGEIEEEIKMSDLMAYSSQPHKLPDEIEIGRQTLLNTDPVMYASFINRVSDEIYSPWVRNVREAVDVVRHFGRKLEATIYVTKLMVTLNPEGELLAIQTLKSSGVFEIDEASKKALWNNEPFPNPPRLKSNKNEFLEFAFEFHFEWNTSFFGIVPWGV